MLCFYNALTIHWKTFNVCFLCGKKHKIHRHLDKKVCTVNIILGPFLKPSIVNKTFKKLFLVLLGLILIKF